MNKDERNPVSIGFVNPQYNADQGFNEKGSNELSADPPPAAAMIKPYDGHPDSHVLSDMPQDDGPNQWAGFSDRAIRLAFVRKVYAILSVQLAFTFALTSLFCFEKNVQKFVRTNPIIYFSAYITFLVVYIAMVCSANLRRKWPTNFILLGVFTICMSYMVATISSYHDTNIVLIAAGITTVCCFVVVLFSMNTKHDITSCGGFLFTAVWVLLIFGIMCIFMRNQVATLIYAACGALLFMMFLAYDTQLILGGHKYSISPEEHIYGALQLYLDVVNIFLYILMLLGGGKK